MSEATVKLDDVTRIFDKGIGVMHLDLAVRPGECLALLGPNGSGKTTTLRLVMGMLIPDKGSVTTFGVDPRKQPIELKQKIGYVSEDQSLPHSLRPIDLFNLWRSLYPTWDQEALDAHADRMELPLHRNLGRMSRGQRRQVALLGAIVHKPKLLVLDEPAGGLDPLMRRSFMESVIEVLGEGGSTVLFSSHHLDQVERISDRIAFLNRGKVVLDRPAGALRDEAVRVLVDGVTRDEARAQPEVVAARMAEDRVAVTMLAEPARARTLVEEELGGRVVQTHELGLEDLFVDILRGAR